MIRRHRRELLLMDSLILIVFLIIVLQGPLGPSPDAPTGRVTQVASQVFVQDIVNMTCNVTLIEPWNLASTYCEPFNASIDSVFESINNTIVSAHTYWPNESLDYWKAYNPSLPNWTVQDLTSITRLMGYWIRVSQNDTLSHNGTWYSPTFVGLWNPLTLAGYPTNTTYPVNLSLEFINTSVDTVYLYNASDTVDPWKVYVVNTSNPALNDLKEFVPYHGLWFKMFSDDTWMVIWE